MFDTAEKYHHLIATLNKIGVALSAERDNSRLLEIILSGAMELTNADGGTLYLVDKGETLSFAIMANTSLNIKLCNTSEKKIDAPTIPLYVNNVQNLKNVASYCFHHNKVVNIDDVYNVAGFDFSGARKMDEQLKYHSQSFLTIPLRDHENKTIGVLQLINAKDEKTNDIIPFHKERVIIAESLASQAAITLTKQKLILAQKKLFDALLQFIAKAIDEKSIYTSNHCSRVPVLTMMIASAVNDQDSGPLKDCFLSKEQFDELSIAAWLHDCGKIVIPEYVMNKATKLETITDRIEMISHRIEILKRDAKIELLETTQQVTEEEKNLYQNKYEKRIQFLNQAKDFIEQVNIGGEVLSDEDVKRIRSLGNYTYYDGNKMQSLLSEKDIENLSIVKGTLNDNERTIIENHVSITELMLQSLPYPEHLKNVPKIAGSHHERVNGKGYPRGLAKDEITLQARILAIADIFEALTAADRPYKKAKTLKEVLHLMGIMKKNGHIDPDVYDIFITKKVYLNYAKKFLSPEQIDI